MSAGVVERLRDRGRADQTYANLADRREAADALEVQSKRIAELESQLAAAREALRIIACFDDYAANEGLRLSGSYRLFDEPASVQIARTALAGGPTA